LRKRIKTAAERRKNVAQGKRAIASAALGSGSSAISRGAAKESFTAPRLQRSANPYHGLRPWLHSFAAPRLGAMWLQSSAASRLGSFSILLLLMLPSCRQDMADQPRYRPLQESTFFADHRSARPLPVGVVARGFLNDDEHLFTGRVNGELAAAFPFELTADVLERGRERYGIFCTPCHDHVGTGNGMAVRRGFRRGPPSFHLDRLRDAPVGHFYDVISNGFGAMNDYAGQIKPRDRWAIVAYIRALQLSQNVRAQDLPAEDRQALERLPR
jgi:cbb3-type cytochrome c oxidase subunit III